MAGDGSRPLGALLLTASALLFLFCLPLFLCASPLGALSGPDLVVSAVTVDPPLPDVGEPCTITLQVENPGTGAASGFWTHLYVDPVDDPPLPSTLHTSRWYLFGLPAGGRVLYERTHTFTGAGCDHVVYGWVDPTGAVTELDENNNVLSQTVCVGVQCQADAYEEDDECASAKWQNNTDGVPQHRTLCPVGDVDWIKFTAVSGVSYTVQANNLGTHADPLLSLYRTCGGELLAGPGRSWEWRAPSSGVYYVRVVHRQADYGPLASYDLVINSQGGTQDEYEPDDDCSLARDDFRIIE